MGVGEAKLVGKVSTQSKKYVQRNFQILRNNMKHNVTIEDIQTIEAELGIELTNEQRLGVWNEFNRVVMDRGESWGEIIEDLIKKVKEI